MNAEYQDLIERYLTGQASAPEAAELLQAMRSDPSLASAMEATSVIYDATEADAASYKLPSSSLDRLLLDAESLQILPTTTTFVAPTVITSIAILVVGSALVFALTMFTKHPGVVQASEDTTNEPVHLQVYVPNDKNAHVDRSYRSPITSNADAAPKQTATIAQNDIMILQTATQDVQLHVDHADELSTPSAPLLAERQRSQEHDFSLRVASRPVTSFSYTTSSSGSTANNLMVELGYDLNDKHQIGVSVHQDQFPVNEHISSEQRVEHTEITWYGVQYRFQPDVSLPFEARPFVQLGMGGSELGILTQPTIGISIPLSGFQLGIGVDAVLMTYQYQGNWSTAASPGLRCELGYQFSFTNL
ncbi:MAG: hypothetical protein EHM43_00495 [Ignavibacteriae bacterium]|nr:MAG: hypothetical protein EHM43_00495 [Ignavibacteriota bacterium]